MEQFHGSGQKRSKDPKLLNFWRFFSLSKLTAHSFFEYPSTHPGILSGFSIMIFFGGSR